MDDQKPFLKHYAKWKALNDEFSLYDYLFQVLQTKQIDSDILFSAFELFWPTFLKKDNYVFLKEPFNQSNYNDLKERKQPIEYWMNFVLLSPYFEEDDNRCFILAEKMALSWSAKLEKEFPDHHFNVKVLFDEETGDCGTTFYQCTPEL